MSERRGRDYSHWERRGEGKVMGSGEVEVCIHRSGGGENVCGWGICIYSGV